MARRALRGTLALVALQVPAMAQAQSPAPGNNAVTSRLTSYGPEFFAPSAPQTALDIARLVPGFTIDLGDTGRRGFGEAAGNVVINGARPSTKAEDLATTLSRIPASRVVRVELGPGDLFSADYAAKSQVLNVILDARSGLAGNVTVSAWRIYDGRVLPDAKGSLLITRGDSTFNLSAGSGRTDYAEEGTDILTDPSDGNAVEFRRKINRYYQHDPYVSVAWAHEPGENRDAHLNARFSTDQYNLVQSNRVRPVVGPPRRDRLLRDFGDPSLELGGDISRPLAGGAIKFVGLATRRKRDWREISEERPEPQLLTTGGFEQTQKARSGETLGRLTWSRSERGGLTFELGGEAVFNRLTSDLSLFELGPAGERTPKDIPVDEATVRERRAEIFMNVGRPLGSRLRAEAGLTYERSSLRVTGDARANRTLSFLKPVATLDWKDPDGWHALLSLRRTVAQLDFFDFVAEAELVNDRVNAGNAELQPQRAWEARLTLERPILGEGVARIDLGIDRISRLQDRILTDEGFDAPGNLGSARRRFAEVTLDAPLTTLGIPGGRAKLTGQLQSSRVRDPISRKVRRFTGEYPTWKWRTEFRRDVGNWSYGLTARDQGRYTYFRTDELDTFWDAGVTVTAFASFRPGDRTTITLDADNLLDTSDRRQRFFFDPDRTAGAPALEEQRVRDRHLSFGLTLKQRLGSASTDTE